ncbi:MAG: glyoxalase [Phycisphaera sp.]|nr:glyoxalase [Phycisphaera sp.]
MDLQPTQLNHVALRVRELDASVAFYRDILLLEPMDRPAFDFPGAWFRIGKDQELHLIAGREIDPDRSRRGNHFALRVNDIDAWAKHLDANKIARHGPKLRPDGAKQVYIDDPDGHVVELCEWA